MLHAREAVRLNPEDLRTRLCLGALLLRRSADPKAAAESQVQLGHATRLLEKTEGTKERAGLGSTLGLNIAILRALNRQEQEARELLRTVEQIDDEDTRKRLLQIKAALGN